MTGASAPDLHALGERIRSTPPLTVLSGAGVSAESGVPTFRGTGGLWREFRATDLATPDAFRRDPKLVWEFYQHRRRRVAECTPNEGHRAIAELEAERADTWTVTQNIDGLHALAGSKNVIEMHGSLWRVRCTLCPFGAENRDLGFEAPPSCPDCGSLLRPAIVWFGEALDPWVLESIDKLMWRGGTMLVVGTSGVVAPACQFAAIARRRGAFTIEVNPEATLVESDMEAVVRAPSGRVLPILLNEICPAREAK